VRPKASKASLIRRVYEKSGIRSLACELRENWVLADEIWKKNCQQTTEFNIVLNKVYETECQCHAIVELCVDEMHNIKSYAC